MLNTAYVKKLKTYLVSKCLWWVVDDNCARQIASKNGQIFNVITVNANTVFSK